MLTLPRRWLQRASTGLCLAALAAGQAGCRAHAPRAAEPEPATDAAQPGASPAHAPASSPRSPEGRAERRRPLPVLKVRKVGLHVGGSPNDAATESRFSERIESQFQKLRACYTEVVQPRKGGLFGVDLYIPPRGGRPEVRDVRTGMGGETFRRCVVRVFEQLQFEPLPDGPIVLSYSFRYTLQDE